MSIKKECFKSKPTCKVTFRLPKDMAQNAKKVFVSGDFNEWKHNSTPMKKLKNGEFKVEVNLQKNKEYQFRYLVDGKTWVNEPEADKYVPNGYGEENSVVCV